MKSIVGRNLVYCQKAIDVNLEEKQTKWDCMRC